MITTHQRQFLSPILEWGIIPTDTLVYFEEQLRHRLHSVILDAFKRRARERGLTQKQLAKRIHRSPVTVNRWLSTSSNLTLDSIAVLMVGLGMDFDSFPFTPIEKTVADAEREHTKAEEETRDREIVEKLTKNLVASLPAMIAAIAISLEGQKQSSGATVSPLPMPNRETPSVRYVAIPNQNRTSGGASPKILDFVAAQQARQEALSRDNRLLKMGA
jgi:transcriptional regulator with XRE-family HTH domain